MAGKSLNDPEGTGLSQLCERCWLAIALLVTAGCAGYQLGPTNQETAQARSIQVKPFYNQTIEPRLATEVNDSLRRNLQQDGTYRLETGGQADIILTGTILEYNRWGVSYQPQDVRTPRDYQVWIKAKIRAVERTSGKVLLDQEVQGFTLVRVGNDLVSAERQALPLLADNLARRTTNLLVDGTW